MKKEHEDRQELLLGAVLILVLMEWRKNIKCWNSWKMTKSFNPCSNGMKKERVRRPVAAEVFSVLILVLMEWRKNCFREIWPSPKNCFNPCSNGMKKELRKWPRPSARCCFNPCSNGMKKELMYSSSCSWS